MGKGRLAAIVGGLAVVLLVLAVWWSFDRPFGGVTCWVNFSAETSGKAQELQSNLLDQGVDARIGGHGRDRMPANPVVTVRGGFWQTEASLRGQVLDAVDEVGAGSFDQCNVPSIGD